MSQLNNTSPFATELTIAEAEEIVRKLNEITLSDGRKVFQASLKGFAYHEIFFVNWISTGSVQYYKADEKKEV